MSTTSTLRNNSSFSTNDDHLKFPGDQENQPPSSEDNNGTNMNVKKFIQQTNIPESTNINSIAHRPRKAASIPNLGRIVEDHELSGQQLSPSLPILPPPAVSSQYSSLPSQDEKPAVWQSPVAAEKRSVFDASTQSTFTMKNINLQPKEELMLPESHENLSILEQSSPRPNAAKLSSYQTRLRYEPNQDFSCNDKSSFFQPAEYEPETNSPPPSIPNTFKYKSHPNAKTKTKLGSEILEEEEEHKTTGTVDWMPSELKDKWVSDSVQFQPTAIATSNSDPVPAIASDDFSSSVRITKSQPILHKNPSFPTTMIHNSQVETQETAEWKRAAQEYNNNQQNKLVSNIFQSMDSNSQKQPTTVKSTHSSTLSTPIGTLTRQMIPEQQQQQQERIEKSPLKLYRNNYDTYTKKALHGVLENFSNKSNVNTPISRDVNNQNGNNSHKSDVHPPPPLKININQANPEQNHVQTIVKNLNKGSQYNEEHYKRKADDLFSNLKRGYGQSSNNLGQSKSHTTATSTPLANNVRNIEEDQLSEYSSFTSGFNSKEEEEEEGAHAEAAAAATAEQEEVNLYTQETSSRIQYENESEYTYDEEEEDDNGTFTEKSPRLSSPHRLNNEIIQISRPDYQRLAEENAELKQMVNNMSRNPQPVTVQQFHHKNPQQSPEHSTISGYNDSDNIGFFKWKNVSQLYMDPTPQKNKPQVIRGHVIPDDNLPMEYDNMIFDKKNMRWQPKQNGEHYSLDSIEDLTATQNFTTRSTQQQLPSIDHRKTTPKKKRSSKLEVSFHIPNSDRSAKNSSLQDYDVTGISHLEDVTFTQSHKQLISIINEILKGGDHWERIRSISLSNFDLENIKDLDQFLPNLQRLDISNNNIKYLTGIPVRILDLDLSNNNISDITSFRDLFDLSMVNLCKNSLVGLNNLSHNIHLSELHLANNSIVSLDGLQDLVKLQILDVSENKLNGELDLSQFDWPNLRVLNVCDNQITKITGWEENTDLHVLLANDNQISKFEVKLPNYTLKKLGLKFNNLKTIDIENLYDLRLLRIDGNKLEQISDLRNLHNLEEISAKSQNPNILSTIMNTNPCMSNLDISGNRYYFNTTVLQPVPLGAVTKLTVCALGLESIPENFSKLFPSVVDLNLNFNKINDISYLAGLKLRKLYLVGNELPAKQVISDAVINIMYTCLGESRSSLISLDLRMNPLTRDIYPYVISPDELDGPIQIDNAEDIDGFIVHYEAIKKGNEFMRRDEEFLMKHQNNGVLLRRIQYEIFCLGMFCGLSKLDGISLTEQKKNRLIEQAKVEFAKRRALKVRK